MEVGAYRWGVRFDYFGGVGLVVGDRPGRLEGELHLGVTDIRIFPESVFQSYLCCFVKDRVGALPDGVYMSQVPVHVDVVKESLESRWGSTGCVS